MRRSPIWTARHRSRPRTRRAWTTWPGGAQQAARLRDCLPRGEGEERLRQWMFDTYEILSEHRANRRRVDEGLAPATMLWPWSPGRRIELTPFSVRQAVSGAAVPDVD